MPPHHGLMLRSSEAVAEKPTNPRRLPGVVGVWVFIGADSVIFALLFLSYMQDRRKAPAAFEASSNTLNYNLGGLNTLILLTSSWLVALGAIAARKANSRGRTGCCWVGS